MILQTLEKTQAQVKTNTVQIADNQTRIAMDQSQYTFFAALMLMGAVIIGWFVKTAFKGLTVSNTELKNSIEKLANVAKTIHDDLNRYKTEVAIVYATKEDLRGLKDDIGVACQLRHNRRGTDRIEE